MNSIIDNEQLGKVKNYCEQVKEFSDACCITPLPTKPVLMKKEQVEFITKMVNDELQELTEAISVHDQADALVDAIYYICDTAVKHGLNLDKLFEIVHRANMQKVVDGKVIRREDGKILKPDGWKDPGPLLEKEMERQEQEGSWS